MDKEDSFYKKGKIGKSDKEKQKHLEHRLNKLQLNTNQQSSAENSTELHEHFQLGNGYRRCKITAKKIARDRLGHTFFLGVISWFSMRHAPTNVLCTFFSKSIICCSRKSIGTLRNAVLKQFQHCFLTVNICLVSRLFHKKCDKKCLTSATTTKNSNKVYTLHAEGFVIIFIQIL